MQRYSEVTNILLAVNPQGIGCCGIFLSGVFNLALYLRFYETQIITAKYHDQIRYPTGNGKHILKYLYQKKKIF